MMRFSALTGKIRLMFAAALAGYASAIPYIPPSIAAPRSTETRHGKRNGTVAQVKRAALKAKRRKAHKARCR